MGKLKKPLAILGVGLVFVAVFCPLLQYLGGYEPWPDRSLFYGVPGRTYLMWHPHPHYEVDLATNLPGWRELVLGLGAFSLVVVGFGRYRWLIPTGVLVVATSVALALTFRQHVADYNVWGLSVARDSPFFGPVTAARVHWAYGWAALVAGGLCLLGAGLVRPATTSRYAPKPSRGVAAALAGVLFLFVVAAPVGGFVWVAAKRQAARERIHRAYEDCKYYQERGTAWLAEHDDYPRSPRELADAGFAEYRLDPWGHKYRFANRADAGFTVESSGPDPEWPHDDIEYSAPR